jgi:hypothetical protein
MAAALLLASCQLVRAEPTARIASVALAPVIVDRMSGIAWKAMTAECNRIWSREGIVLTWDGADGDADIVLPLVFDHREVRKHDRKDGDAFGVTVFAGHSQRLAVSIDRAQEVVGRRHGLADSSDGMTLDIAMGTLLGRVVAHEIGHALLLTMTHAASGLMHPHIDADDLRPSIDGQFALLQADRGRLSTRFTNWNPSAQRATDATFTWSDAPPAPSRLRAQR